MKKTLVRLSTRIFPILLAVLFLMAFSVSSFAESDKTGKDTGKPDWTSEKKQEKEEERNQKQNEERAKKTYRGISVEKISLAIDSVTDEETRLALTALLETYIAALSDKDAALGGEGMSLSELSKAASAARSALKDGLEEAGFTLGSVLGWQEWKEYGNETLSLDEISAAIAALDDLDANKAALQDLLTAYQAALTAQETGSEADEDQLKEATQAAREALLEALYTTGIFPLALPEEPVATEEPVME